jgi:hypothetical protein
MDVRRGAEQRRSETSTQMSSTATRFLTQFRRNIASWRAGEIDFATFTESQGDAVDGVRAAGRHVQAEVLRALTGATRVAHLLLEDPRQPSQRHYYGVVARTAAGSPVLRVVAADPRSRQAEHRQVAAMIYEIAADMERRSHQLEVHWTIAVDPENGQVVIELTGDHDAQLADELVTNVMAERQLI